jgi:O-acetyl-ADP-ribose deacetylase (regulator of RNase III)
LAERIDLVAGRIDVDDRSLPAQLLGHAVGGYPPLGWRHGRYDDFVKRYRQALQTRDRAGVVTGCIRWHNASWGAKGMSPGVEDKRWR